MKDKSAIYKITNTITNKFYIGSASFVYSRWGQHRKRLRENTHFNKHLQSSWNKYGEESFIFSIIENVIDKKKLIEREQYWLDKTQCYNREIGYNINLSASSRLGMKCSEETKKKIRLIVKQNVSLEHLKRMTELARQANLGKPKTQLNLQNWKKSRCRKWIAIAPSGEKYEFCNLSEFCREHNLSQSRMSCVASQKAYRHKGWKCIKLSKDIDGRGRKYSKEQRGKMKPPGQKCILASIKTKRKTYKITTPKGEILIVENLQVFCRERQMRDSYFHRVARGERTHYKGFKCEVI